MLICNLSIFTSRVCPASRACTQVPGYKVFMLRNDRAYRFDILPRPHPRYRSATTLACNVLKQSYLPTLFCKFPRLYFIDFHHRTHNMAESSSSNDTSKADSPAGWPPAIVGCSLPLTEAMVETLSNNTRSNASSETQSHSGTEHTYRYHPFHPQSKFDVTSQTFDDLNKLQAYNIYPGTKMLIPTDIQEFIRDVLMHTPEGDRSPNARRVVEACEASRFNDDDFFSHVAVPWLVIPFGRPAPLLTSQPKTRLSSKWLPTARPNIKRIWSTLSDAWPDAITGFTRHAHLDEDETQSAFTPEEEDVVKSK